MVGVAHHVSFMRPYGLFDIAAVSLANSLSLYPFVDSICNKLDFIGVNYYGQVFSCDSCFIIFFCLLCELISLSLIFAAFGATSWEV